MKVVDSRTMAEIDRRAQDEYGFPGVVLMENAGRRAYELLRRRFWGGGMPKGSTVFVVGKGNNGGDAMVIARHLFLDGYRGGVVVNALRPDETQATMCRTLGIPIVSWAEPRARRALSEATTIVDGLTGTGIRGELRAPLDKVVRAINKAPGFTVSIDLPSGTGDSYRTGSPAVRADLTIAMGLPKLSLYLPHARPLCGEILLVDPGFPPELTHSEEIPGTMVDLEWAQKHVAPIGREAYKNRRGTVGVFAGTEGTAGAAVLAAKGAAHSRAGLVNLFVDRSGYTAAAAQLSAIMVRPVDFEGSPDSFSSPVPLEGFDARVVGPGWGRSPGRSRWLRALLESGTGVLDADGITLLAEDKSIHRPLRRKWILTPHPGEFSRLSGIARDEAMADPVPHLLTVAGALGATIVLKAHVTYVGAPDGRYWILDGMNPSLGTGGSGDLLSGIIGGFLANGLPPEVAACAGVLVHHRAGKRAYEELGWYTADELVPFVSQEARLDEGSTRV
jgi:NAD(P)H-hydrate epimerase